MKGLIKMDSKECANEATTLPMTFVSEKTPGQRTPSPTRFARAGLAALAIAGLSCAPAQAVIASDASQVQVVSVGSKTFYSTDTLTWETLPKTKTFAETARNASFIELTTEGEKVQLNIQERMTKSMNPTSKGWKNALPITATSDVAGATINGFSVLVQKSAGRHALDQFDLDQLYTNGAKPSGWRRVVYTLAQGDAPAPTDGHNVMRIDTPEGVKFERLNLKVAALPGKTVWAEYGPYGKMNEATGVISDALETPAFTYLETGRDQWSVYLTSLNRPGPVNIQIDLFQKAVSQVISSSQKKVLYKVLPERRPYYNQFVRTHFDVQSTSAMHMNTSPMALNFSTAGQSVSIDLSTGTCRLASGASCQLLTGDEGARSITGFSVGSIDWNSGGRPVMTYQNHQYFWRLVDLVEGANIANAKAWIPYRKSRTSVDYNLARLDLIAKKIQFTHQGGGPNGAPVPVTAFRNYYAGQFNNFVPIPYLKKAESPGFQISNRTAWPVYVQLEQNVLSVNTCYNRAIIKPGETVMWNTGAVWFDVKAVMNQETVPTDLECATSAIVNGGTILVTTAMGVASGGASIAGGGAVAAVAVRSGIANIVTWVAADRAAAAAANAGWSKEAQIGVNVLVYNFKGALGSGMMAAAGARTAAKLGAQAGGSLVLTTVAVTSGKAAVAIVDEAALVAAKAAAKNAALEAGKQFAMASGSFAAKVTKTYVDDIAEVPMTDAQIKSALAGLTQEAKIVNQYAGHPFPWSGNDRIRPAFVITGGPGRFVYDKTMLVTQQVEAMKIKACKFNATANRYDCAGDIGM